MIDDRRIQLNLKSSDNSRGFAIIFLRSISYYMPSRSGCTLYLENGDRIDTTDTYEEVHTAITAQINTLDKFLHKHYYNIEKTSNTKTKESAVPKDTNPVSTADKEEST